MKIEPIIVPVRKPAVIIEKKKKPEKKTKKKVKKEIKKSQEEIKPVKEEIKTPVKEIKESLEEEIKKPAKETIKEVKKPVKKIPKRIIEEKKEHAERMKKEEMEWSQGPLPSTKKPKTPQYAFEPTKEELELMKNLEGEDVLKPTAEEEEIMEQVREPDFNKEFEPTPEEMSFMKKKGIIKPATGERTRTGIEGLDELTRGGIPKGKCVAVVGGPGTGKSILLMQFLINGAENHGEPGLYITFEEEVNELKENYNGFNFNMKDLEKKGLLKVIHYNPMRIKRFIKNMDITLRDLITSMKAKRIVIDSLSAFTLLFQTEGEQREGLFELFQTLKKLGVTALLSTESWREPTLTKSGVIEFIADGVIMMYNLKIGDTRVRAIEVLKMRGIEHEARIVPFKIENDGIKVFTDEEVFGAREKEFK